jgi:hypothetical protein
MSGCPVPASSWTDTEQYRGEIRRGAQDVLKKLDAAHWKGDCFGRRCLALQQSSSSIFFQHVGWPSLIIAQRKTKRNMCPASTNVRREQPDLANHLLSYPNRRILSIPS